MGRFSTECELILNDTLRFFFINEKLTREEDDPKYFQNYSNQVMNIFVNNNLVLSPNGQRIIEYFITQYGDDL